MGMLDGPNLHASFQSLFENGRLIIKDAVCHVLLSQEDFATPAILDSGGAEAEQGLVIREHGAHLPHGSVLPVLRAHP